MLFKGCTWYEISFDSFVCQSSTYCVETLVLQSNSGD